MRGFKRERKWGTRRGAGLPTVLMVSALVLALAFTVVGVSYNHLNMSSRVSNNQQAENLAEAAVARAIDQVMASDGAYGKAAGATIQVQFPNAPEGAVGLLSFDSGDATSYSILKSTNNLETDSSTTGDGGTTVPAEAVHLVGVGRCSGVEKVVDAMLYIPRFPYVIGSSGPIRSSGGLFVAGVKDKTALDAGWPIPDDQLIPGDLVSNASSGGDGAVQLDGSNQVKGDVQSSQGATLSTETVVEGEVRLYADPVKIPDLDILSYDPGTGADVKTNGDLDPAAAQIDGKYRYTGDLTVTNGLQLQGGLLFVEGNLTVNDGIHGKGAIIVTGTTTVNGGGSASTDNLAAILAGDTVTIEGDPDGNAMFEGLIYTEGNLNARYMTLAGTFVANNSSPSGDTMTFEDANLIQVPEYASQSGTGPTFPSVNFDLNIQPISSPALFPELNPANGGPGPQAYPDFDVGPASLVSPSKFMNGSNNDMNWGKDYSQFPFQYRRIRDGAGVGTSPNAYTVLPTDVVFYVKSTGNTVASSGLGEEVLPKIEAWLLPILENCPNGRAPGTGLTQAERDWITNEIEVNNLNINFYQNLMADPAARQFTFEAVEQTSGPPPVSYSIDLSDFFTVADSIRILYWRERE